MQLEASLLFSQKRTVIIDLLQSLKRNQESWIDEKHFRHQMRIS